MAWLLLLCCLHARFHYLSFNPVLKFSHDSKLLVSASYPGTVKVWNVKLSLPELVSYGVAEYVIRPQSHRNLQRG